MPLKNGRLTARERAFATALAATDDKQYAAWAAGYRGTSAIYEAMMKPAIQALTRKIRRQRLEQLGTLALDHYERVLLDPTEPTKEKTKVAGLVGKELQAELDADGDDRADWDLSPAEIRGRIGQLEAALARRSPDVTDVEPDPAPALANNDDLFG